MKNNILNDDRGFTLIEVVIVIVLTGILAGLFGQILVSSLDIYVDHDIRKTALIDARRSMNMFTHDVQELVSWSTSPTSSHIRFNKASCFEGLWSRIYYSTLRVAYTFTGTEMTYRQNDDGDWGNQYMLLGDRVSLGSCSFTVVSIDGNDLVSVSINMTVNGKPMRIRTATFPRYQGG